MVWVHERLQATDPAQSTCFVVLEHVLGVYVDNVPCTTPPFAVFIEPFPATMETENDKWQECGHTRAVVEIEQHNAFAI